MRPIDRVEPLFVAPEGLSQLNLQIDAIGLFFQHFPQVGYGFVVQIALGVDTRQCAARQGDALRGDAIAPRIQAAQFTLNQLIARRDIEGALHMPDRQIEFIVAIVNNAQADARHKVFRIDVQDALEHILRRAILLFFEQRLAQQAIGFDAFGILREQMPAVLNGLVVGTAFDQPVDLIQIIAEIYFSHIASPIT